MVNVNILQQPCHCYFFNILSFSANFLSYHPNIVTTSLPGWEISFFENDKAFEKGADSYLKMMPNAKGERKILVKNKSIWYDKDVLKVLIRLRGTILQKRTAKLLIFLAIVPSVKILLIVRDPIG